MVFSGDGLTKNANRAPIAGEWYHPFFHKLVDKLNNGFAPVIGICGKQGAGKSVTAVRIVEKLYDEMGVFDGEWTNDQLVYEALPFLKQIDAIDTPDPGDDINEDRKLFIFDEGGVNLNSKDFHDATNRSVDEVLQTMRIKNCCYIFISPEISDLDSAVRDNLDFIITMTRTGVAKITGLFKVKDRVDGKRITLPINYGYWNVDMPDDELLNEYRDKEYPQKEQFVKDKIDELEPDEEEEDEYVRL